eukprot:gnl/TRDRNA2_/TRDRNA2_191986_c0_seq1.p1 gnl/TRDRNA2_/TRDRNA2_191986_c0~~gnl/TRDRNA2_/TRDRNA2_191986_c0_seq1.p1  ORF type:complete len:130 (+),score=31.65 gnl/TRDRNA2_/TRDRNA2_191986_c0_seq1:71-460(+)
MPGLHRAKTAGRSKKLAAEAAEQATTVTDGGGVPKVAPAAAALAAKSRCMNDLPGGENEQSCGDFSKVCGLATLVEVLRPAIGVLPASPARRRCSMFPVNFGLNSEKHKEADESSSMGRCVNVVCDPLL